MNRRESNRMAMFITTRESLNNNRDTIAEIPALAAVVEKFEGMVDAITVRDNEYKSESSGKTAAKRAASATLRRVALRVAGPLYVLGRNINDETVKAACGITASDLGRLREVDLPQPCGRILALAEAHAEEIADYGVSSGDIAAFKTDLAAYNGFLADKHQKQAKSKAARELLRREFSAVDELLSEELDPMMNALRYTHEAFYQLYITGRDIKNLTVKRSPRGGDLPAATEAVVPVEQLPVAA